MRPGQVPLKYLGEILPAERYALLYGPMISEEIRQGSPALAGRLF